MNDSAPTSCNPATIARERLVSTRRGLARRNSCGHRRHFTRVATTPAATASASSHRPDGVFA
jgi:hypothetical protein